MVLGIGGGGCCSLCSGGGKQLGKCEIGRSLSSEEDFDAWCLLLWQAAGETYLHLRLSKDKLILHKVSGRLPSACI